MEINQASGNQSVKGATHYDITVVNDIARDTHCDIKIGNDVTRHIHCDVTMRNDVAMCTDHGITMHNDIALNLYFYYVLLARPIYVILLWMVWNKNKNKFGLISLAWRTLPLFLCWVISLILWTREISMHKTTYVFSLD